MRRWSRLLQARSRRLIRFAPSGVLRAIAGNLWARLRYMLHTRRTRQMLSEMDDRMLADFGVGRGDALMEASRPMWDRGGHSP